MYDFSTLSPFDFELLVRDLLRVERGWNQLEAFGHGPDGGVDLRQISDDSLKTVVQCKHYVGSTFSQLRASFLAEVEKMKSEKPDQYVAVTSAALSKTQKDRLCSDLETLIGNPADLIDRISLNEILARWRSIERKHFKLWLASSEVLQSVANSGIWARSEALLEDVQDRVRLYVSNPSFQRASDILDEKRKLLITGPPGVGKSLLAEMLMLTHWHSGWEVVQIGSDVEEAWRVLDKEANQIFLYDDFLGQTDFAEALGKNEDNRLAQLIRSVARKPNKRLVLTSRTQVMKQAEQGNEAIRRAAVDMASCTLGMTDYSRFDRAHILYNHLYFSDLARNVIQDYCRAESYWRVIHHQNFSPRLIEQVIRRGTQSSNELTTDLLAALNTPTELWGPTFQNGLSELAQRILLCLVTFPQPGVNPDQLAQVCGIQPSSRAYESALRAMEGTWITITPLRYRRMNVDFADPSCRDYVLSIVDSYETDFATTFDSINTPKQLRLLLEYAASRQYLSGGATRGSFKYPGIRAALKSRTNELETKVKDSWEQVPTYSGAYDVRVPTIAAFVNATEFMWDGFRDWILTQLWTLEKHSPAPRSARVSDLGTILKYLSAASRSVVRADELEDLIKTVAYHAADMIVSTDDFDAFRAIAEEIDPELLDEAIERAREAVIDDLQSEIEGMNALTDDLETMTSRLDEIADYIASSDLGDALELEVSSKRSDVEEAELRQPNLQNLRPSDSEEAFESVDEEKRPLMRSPEREDPIRALFDQLQ